MDFNSEKRSKSCRTRTLARHYLLTVIAPLLYVAACTEAQRWANDYKESSAALTALISDLF